MGVAEIISQASEAKRLKVGAIAVQGDMIIGDGYNGTPRGFQTNEPEYREPAWFAEPRLETRPETIHAEMNMLAKITRSSNSSTGCTVFCTHAPCIKCAIHLHQAGVSSLFFKSLNPHKPRDNGLAFLETMKIGVTKL